MSGKKPVQYQRSAINAGSDGTSTNFKLGMKDLTDQGYLKDAPVQTALGVPTTDDTGLAQKIAASQADYASFDEKVKYDAMMDLYEREMAKFNALPFMQRKALEFTGRVPRPPVPPGALGAK